MTPPHTELGALVRARREFAGLSQQALADLAGVSRESVNRLENATGPWAPRPHKIAQVLSALGITVPEVTDIVADPELFVELVAAMEAVASVELSTYVQPRTNVLPDVGSRTDLVLISPNGATVTAQVNGSARVKAQTAREMGDALTEKGWTVASAVS